MATIKKNKSFMSMMLRKIYRIPSVAFEVYNFKILHTGVKKHPAKSIEQINKSIIQAMFELKDLRDPVMAQLAYKYALSADS